MIIGQPPPAEPVAAEIKRKAASGARRGKQRRAATPVLRLPPQGPVLSLKEAAERLGVNRSTVSKMAGKKIGCVVVGEASRRRVLIPKAELDRYLAAHYRPPSQPGPDLKVLQDPSPLPIVISDENTPVDALCDRIHQAVEDVRHDLPLGRYRVAELEIQEISNLTIDLHRLNEGLADRIRDAEKRGG